MHQLALGTIKLNVLTQRTKKSEMQPHPNSKLTRGVCKSNTGYERIKLCDHLFNDHNNFHQKIHSVSLHRGLNTGWWFKTIVTVICTLTLIKTLYSV